MSTATHLDSWLVSLRRWLIFAAVALVVVPPFYAATARRLLPHTRTALVVTIPYRATHAGADN